MTAAVPRWRWWAALAVGLVALMLTLVSLSAAAGSSDGASPGGDSADAGFSRDMAVHHQQAVELSFIVRERTDDEDVRRLAYDVINTQANQRGMMLGWLDLWDLPKSSSATPMAWMGHDMTYEARDGSLMPGMATNTELDALREAEGRAAEVLYLQLLTTHHQGGVEMAQAAAGMAGTEVVARLAEGMVKGQQAEMALMADLLKERGATAER